MEAVDISGQRFGRLIAVRRVDKRWGDKVKPWECICDCGKQTIATVGFLRAGNVRSCGCFRSDLLVQRNTKHGLSKIPEYKIWKGMKERCENKNSQFYEYYGGRGIRVSDEWRNDFVAFIDHVGRRPHSLLTLDRIDNNGNYEPGNVRWATKQQQSFNRRKWRHRSSLMS